LIFYIIPDGPPLFKKKLDALRRNGTGVSALDRGRRMWYDSLDQKVNIQRRKV